MTFVVADNDPVRMRGFTQLLLSVYPNSVIHEYVDPMLSASFILDHPVDAVFAETRMGRVDGVTLLHVLRVNRPTLPIFLLSDDESCREAAMAERTSGYLLRPVKAEDLRNTLPVPEPVAV